MQGLRLLAIVAWGLLDIGYTLDAGAAVIRVPLDAPTIQAGIDAAAEGDTVLVAPGTYAGDGNHSIDFSLSTAPEPHNVVLRSEAGAASTIIDVAGGPSARRRGFRFKNGEGPSSVVEGFTIRNGYMSDPTARLERHDLSAGGILFQGSGTAPIIRDCIIESCTSFYSGGGLEAEIFAAPTIERCVLRGNVSEDRGGGMSMERFSMVTLIDCVITGNVAAVSGGGLEVEADATILGCTIAGNRAGRGGGLDVKFPADPIVTRSIVFRNTADGSGGDVYVGNDATAAFSCSIVDTTRMDTLGSYTFVDGLASDPLFCAPVSPVSAPTTAGDFTLASNSPGLLSASPCGERIGAYGEGCGPVTPTHTTTWGELKRLFHPGRGR